MRSSVSCALYLDGRRFPSCLSDDLGVWLPTFIARMLGRYDDVVPIILEGDGGVDRRKEGCQSADGNNRMGEISTFIRGCNHVPAVQATDSIFMEKYQELQHFPWRRVHPPMHT